MKIAIVGTGIAGNLAANRLARDHDITVYEADARIGGHSNTVEVESAGRQFAVDTGFIVFNDRTYPNFCRLLEELQVPAQDSSMSFSVRSEQTGLEYCGSSLNTLFAQRRNLLRPTFHRMLKDILRFNREAGEFLQSGSHSTSLNEFLHEGRYSREFIDHYIIPMGAAIWSSTPEGMGEVPADFFFRFFQNHGLLTVDDRPQWRVVSGGSCRYVEKLVAGHRERIRLNTPVESIRRVHDGVILKTSGAEPEHFDFVFLACHSDQALALLSDPTSQEREVLGAIRYQHNQAVLHTDRSLMPRRRRAWAAWNYHIKRKGEPQGGVALTYHMNTLQSLQATDQICVTLNHRKAIDERRILQVIDYQHPIFTERAVAAQKRHREINGMRRSYYCGAYWRYGFHEDGVVSALRALAHFEHDLKQQSPMDVRAA
jgi:predicted NAD/FAD-binding protein